MPKRFVRRKWGFYITLLDRKHFKVKLLRFWKHKKCSYQYHNQRSEVWLFLKGSGIFTWQTNRDLKLSGEYGVAAQGELHSYQAIKPTWILEIQYGEKCDETDIVRV